MGRLFCNSLELDESAHRRNDHSLDHFHTTRQGRAVVGFILAEQVIPDLAIRTLAVPAEIPV